METNDGSLDYAIRLQESTVLGGGKGCLSPLDKCELGGVGKMAELLVMSTSPSKLRDSLGVPNKSGFFGVEAHPAMPIEMVAVALASYLFERYEILVVDSFQLMNQAKPQELNASIEKTRQKLQLLAESFNLKFNFSLCSEFFKTKQYKELFHETEAAVLKSDDLAELVRKTIPERKNKNNLSYAIHEIATTLYMHTFKGADVKVGQQREKLYDSITQVITNGLDKGIGFAYLFPFFALGTKEPEEVTPYKPGSGTRNGGKRILLDEIDRKSYGSIAQLVSSSTAEAKKNLYRMALAAGLASGETTAHEVFYLVGGFAGQSFPFDDAYLDKQFIDTLFRFVIRPYETRKIDGAVGRYLQTG